MADEAKAEKLAAARKRAAELAAKKNKKKGKKGTASKEEEKDAATEATPAAEAEPTQSETPAPPADDKPAVEEAVEDSPKEEAATAADDEPPASPSQTHASLAHQSKLRSASFRQGSISAGSGPMSPGPFSPSADGETATDIYRKQVARIEELEKENKRLTKETSDAEKRWQKAEEELADLREDDGENGEKKPALDSQVEQLKSEIAALERQNAQLQQQVSRSGAARHASSPSAAGDTELEAQLASKSATVESMELELSKLRAQLDRGSSEREQIAALEERVERAEKAAGLAQRELADVRRNLDRTAEKAVREGSERTSAETKIRTLEHDLADALSARFDAEKKADGLEKKIATLTTLHKEQDARTQGLRKDKERAEKEAGELKSKTESLEAENIKLRSRRSTEGGGGLDDDGVDELEDEERAKLQRKIRDLEGEVHDLRRGAWAERRAQLSGAHGGVASPGGGFQDVDLGGASPLAGRKHSGNGGGGFGDFFQSGINALTGHHAGGDEAEGFLDDEDMDFDEDAFRKAQEEDAKARIERIKDIKRGLKNWEGWRLDLVEARRGGEEGIGEVFEV